MKMKTAPPPPPHTYKKRKSIFTYTGKNLNIVDAATIVSQLLIVLIWKGHFEDIEILKMKMKKINGKAMEKKEWHRKREVEKVK